MDSKRSYLESLNAGRLRRPQMTLEQLNLSLEQLERQLDQRTRQQRAEQDIYRPSRQRLAEETAPYYERQPASHWQNVPVAPRPAPQPVRPAARAHGDEAATLADELKALRSEMHALLAEPQQGRQPANGYVDHREATEIRTEIERLTDAVQTLTQRSDDRPFNALRLELEQARAAIGSLAREDTVRAISERWEDFERRMAAQERAPAHDQNFDQLSQRIDQMYDALNSLPDALPLQSLEERMHKLTGAVEHFASQADAPKGKSLSAIETRLDEISRAIAATSAPKPADTAPLQRLESRINALSNQIEDRFDRAAPIGQRPGDEALMDTIDARFNDIARRLDADQDSKQALFGIESRLEQLTARLDKPVKAAPAVDPLLVSNLEAQIASLSSYLARPDQQTGGELAPRLERLEQSLDGNRDLVIQAASEAAEAAVRRMGGASPTNADAAAALADDLRQLEGLTRRSDERNAKTFEAIHDTLLKIVDRLGSLENTDRTGVADASRRMFNLPSAPSIVPEDQLPPVEREVAAAVAEQPVIAAEQAAVAATALAEDAPAKSSMFGGLARRLGRKAPTEKPLAGEPVEPAFAAEAPEVELDQPLDPKAINRPLEPGSGAPDLNAIMKRVRDERAGPRQAESDAGKADFIAAARRAAQAAAAEAEVLKTSSGEAGAKGGFGELFKARRKPILMAAVAVMIALAGLQLSKSFVNDPADLTEDKADATDTLTVEPSAEPATVAEAEKPAELPPVRVAEPSPQAAPAAEPAPVVASTAMMPDSAGPDTLIEPAAPAQASVASAPVNSTTGSLAPATSETISAPAPFVATPQIDIPTDAGPIPLREAAAAGDSKALFEIGARYADGRGVKADMAQAAKWYEKSADLGFAPAQYRIGNFYEKGTGVARDVIKAKTWYQLAANQGNASAMHNLAVLYAMGADGTADNDSAVRWFTQAADFGVKDSQFNLGILAAKGVGMPQSLEESYKWFAIVAKAGDRDATAKRDEIAKSLRPEQLEKARASVELWKPKELNVEANSADIPESWQESQAQTASIDMKKAIRNVQAILNKNGYDAGGADGVMGDRTKQAIVAFQKDNGLEANGVVDKALVEALLAKK